MRNPTSSQPATSSQGATVVAGPSERRASSMRTSATSSPASTANASTLGTSTSARGTGIWVSAKRVQTHRPSYSSSRYRGETARLVASCWTGVWFSTAL
jgi:hypothetical protein